ncbi:MAG: PEGA domain-containing protein [Candidatus Acidiferrales bacterium]
MSANRLRECLLATIVCALATPPALPPRSETLTIASTPSGATLEIDGIPAGTTPFEQRYPASYFHKPHALFSARLEHPMTAKLSKPGYLEKTLELTYGPLRWVSINGKEHGDYYLFKMDHIEVTLVPDSKVAPEKGKPATPAQSR